MKQVYKDKDLCCGCTACFSICPVHAITMSADEQGFFYPAIDQIKCIDCRLCVKTCSFQNTISLKLHEPECYAVKHKDIDVIKNSRSEGVFTALSDYVLESGGVVYGASLDSDFVVRHHRATNKDERNLFRKSKYVQSDLNAVFEKVKNDLEKNKVVLFTGTPCQVDALLSYVNKANINNRDLLILCDIICDGVPSPLFYKKYRQWIENRYKGKIDNYEFRNKDKYPWWTCIESFEVNGIRHYMDWYGNLFGDSYITRPSCFKCKYSSIYHMSDITLGDFWGVEKIIPEYFSRTGCSLVLIHSKKGEKLFNEIKALVDYKVVKPCDVLQPRLLTPPGRPIKYDEFWNKFQNESLTKVLKEFGSNSVSFSSMMKHNIIFIIKLPYRFIKKIIKYLIGKGKK